MPLIRIKTSSPFLEQSYVRTLYYLQAWKLTKVIGVPPAGTKMSILGFWGEKLRLHTDKAGASIIPWKKKSHIVALSSPSFITNRKQPGQLTFPFFGHKFWLYWDTEMFDLSMER